MVFRMLLQAGFAALIALGPVLTGGIAAQAQQYQNRAYGPVINGFNVEEVRRLDGVADDPHQGVPARDGERVGGLVVLHQADQLAQLLRIQVGEPLLVGQHGIGEDISHTEDHAEA